MYDPSKISYARLLKILFSVAHDPAQLNRQGPDTGTQYRSAIFFTNEEQQKIAQAYVNQLQAAKVYRKPIVTLVTPLKAVYQAEDYHLDYPARNPYQPYIVINDLPKLAALKKEFPELYRGKWRSLRLAYFDSVRKRGLCQKEPIRPDWLFWLAGCCP